MLLQFLFKTLRRFDRDHAALAAELARERAARKHGEAALAEIQRVAKAASWEWDLASGRVEWDPALYRLLALSPEGPPPSRARFIALVHVHDRARAATWLAGLARDGAPAPFECRVQRGDGEIRLMRCEAAPEHDEGGALRRLLVTLRDIGTTRPEAWTLPSDAARIETGALVGAAVFLAEAEAGAAGIELIATASPGLGSIAGTEAVLTEIVYRLIANAVARSPQGGRVAIRASGEAGGGVAIEVADAGPAPEQDTLAEMGVLVRLKSRIETAGGTLRLAALPGGGLAASVVFPPGRVMKKVA